MAKVTLVFAVLLIALGLVGYLGTGSLHPTALIPTWIGLALGIGGFLAISPNESRRKLFMHINVTIGLLGFLGGAIEALRGYAHARAERNVWFEPRRVQQSLGASSPSCVPCPRPSPRRSCPKPPSKRPTEMIDA